MQRIWAIIERDLRRFRRSPALIAMSCLMPLVQLVFLGYAFGGEVRHMRLGIVDHDHGLPAIKIREMCQAVASNSQTFDPISYGDMATAMGDLKTGKVNGVLEIPADFSRKFHAGLAPTLGFVEDNTDQFSSNALGGAVQQLIGAYGQTPVVQHLNGGVTLSVVEIYPYIPYIQFLLPGTIVLAIFISAMIGGGIIYIDDKARGLHEGYLVTPISKFELIMGFNLAGVFKAMISGIVLMTLGSVIAGVTDPLNLMRMARLMVLIVVTAMALISMMFLIMVRINDPLLPRAIFGMLNTVLFFPSGAVYPINAFPQWMRIVTMINPFTYAVHGFKTVLLKNTGLGAAGWDIAFLVCFSAVCLGVATKLFRRTL